MPQIQYRLGSNKEAIALYSQLFRGAPEGEAAGGVQSNVLAAYVAGGRAGEVPAVMTAMKVGWAAVLLSCRLRACVLRGPCASGWRALGLLPPAGRQPSAAGLPTAAAARPSTQVSPRDSFELAFNAACGLLETGDLPGAEEQLHMAVRAGESSERRCVTDCVHDPPAAPDCARAASQEAEPSR